MNRETELRITESTLINPLESILLVFSSKLWDVDVECQSYLMKLLVFGNNYNILFELKLRKEIDSMQYTSQRELDRK